MANKKVERGNYICKSHYYDIYCKFTYEGKGKERKVSSHVFDIYHAKRKLEGGFKTKDEAIEKTNEMFEQGVKANKHGK